jgi:crotonobetainyl-CoA:carnitine CoA-transferase CaiB-like acyl-CoA transferase
VLDKPEYRTTSDRQRLKDEVVEAISSVTRRLTSDEIVRRLGAVRVNVAKLNSIGQAAESEQLRAAGGVVAFDYRGEPVKAVATPFKLKETPAEVRRAPPLLGADTVEILHDYGFEERQIADARTAGAFGQPISEQGF